MTPEARHRPVLAGDQRRHAARLRGELERLLDPLAVGLAASSSWLQERPPQPPRATRHDRRRGGGERRDPEAAPRSRVEGRRGASASGRPAGRVDRAPPRSAVGRGAVAGWRPSRRSASAAAISRGLSDAGGSTGSDRLEQRGRRPRRARGAPRAASSQPARCSRTAAASSGSSAPEHEQRRQVADRVAVDRVRSSWRRPPALVGRQLAPQRDERQPDAALHRAQRHAESAPRSPPASGPPK